MRYHLYWSGGERLNLPFNQSSNEEPDHGEKAEEEEAGAEVRPSANQVRIRS
jgi:hypothetical protein